MPPKYDPSRAPKPDIEPIPGSLPKQSPHPPTPLSTSSPKMSPGEDAPGSGNSGEDPTVESGLPDDDPERPRQAEGDEPME